MRTFSWRRNPRSEMISRHEARRRRAERFGGRYVEDMILGANDGIITTFAVVAGATGGALGRLVIVILGFANLFADAVSMGVSNYLGKRSRMDYIQSQKEMEEFEITNMPAQEVEEVRRIFRERGVEGKQLDQVVEAVTENRKAWVDIMMTMELGLSEEEESPIKKGLATSGAFIVAGLIPLIPYLLFPTGSFTISVIFAAATLFVTGSLRTLVTGVNWFRGGLEMLGVGAAAAIVAYGVGAFIHGLTA